MNVNKKGPTLFLEENDTALAYGTIMLKDRGKATNP
jgi:hypothetical protein